MLNLAQCTRTAPEQAPSLHPFFAPAVWLHAPLQGGETLARLEPSDDAPLAQATAQWLVTRAPVPLLRLCLARRGPWAGVWMGAEVAAGRLQDGLRTHNTVRAALEDVPRMGQRPVRIAPDAPAPGGWACHDFGPVDGPLTWDELAPPPLLAALDRLADLGHDAMLSVTLGLASADPGLLAAADAAHQTAVGRWARAHLQMNARPGPGTWEALQRSTRQAERTAAFAARAGVVPALVRLHADPLPDPDTLAWLSALVMGDRPTPGQWTTTGRPLVPFQVSTLARGLSLLTTTADPEEAGGFLEGAPRLLRGGPSRRVG